MPGGLSHIEGELVGFENGDILKPRVKLQSHWAEERLTTLVISKRWGNPMEGSRLDLYQPFGWCFGVFHQGLKEQKPKGL